MVTSKTGPRSDDAGWEREIRALEEEACRAVNSPLNQVVQKAEVLALIRSGRIRHSSLQQQIEQLRRHGDIVIVMGRETIVDPPDGKTVQRRYTNIWRNEGGVWRTIGRHANIMRSAAG